MVKRVLIVALLLLTLGGLLIPVLSRPALAQSGVTVRPNRDYINVRLWPAIGADVIGDMEPGDVMAANGRSVDGDWIRIDFNGDEGWVALLVVTVVGDLNTLPLADPRTIPYNDNAVPAAGGGRIGSDMEAVLEDSGVYMRTGPSTGYATLANLPRYAVMAVTGRNGSGRWVQVSWEGLVGWVSLQNLTLHAPSGVTVYSLPVIPPSAVTGPRLNDANARERFLVADDIRRYVDRARATWEVVEAQWYAFGVAGRPEICSAPPPLEDYYLPPYERHVYPDLGEAVNRLNQGLEDLRNAIQLWLDGCVPGYGGFTYEVIVTGRTAVANARAAIDEVTFRITGSKAVMVTAIHAHYNYALTQFSRIEAIWLDVRDLVIVGATNAPCVAGVPEQPPDYAMTAWERGAYPELIPLVDALNAGLRALRESIGLWEAQCDIFHDDLTYQIPGEIAALGFNSVLTARTALNAVNEPLIAAYEGDGGLPYIAPAPTGTPNPTIAAILHAPYTPTFTPSPTPSFQYQQTQSFLVASHLYAGCTWFGIAGQVVDRNGNPITGALIHMLGGGQDLYTYSGSNSNYGPSGWELPLRIDAAQLNTYTVLIEDGAGNPLSAPVRVDFVDDCTLNAALITFVRY